MDQETDAFWHESLEAVRHIVCGRFVQRSCHETRLPQLAPVRSMLEFLSRHRGHGVSPDFVAGLANCIDVDQKPAQSITGILHDEELRYHLSKGEPLVLFLLNHNVAIRISKVDDSGVAKVSAFPMQVLEEEAMCALRVECTFPAIQVQARKETLSSPSFAFQLIGLGSISPPDTLSSYERDNSTFYLEHGTRNPKNAINFLLPVLAVDANTPITNFQSVAKQVRDEISVSNGSPKTFRRSSVWLALRAMLHSHFVDRLGGEEGRLAYKVLMVEYMVFVWENVSLDLLPSSHGEAHEFLAKIARRLEKIKSTMGFLLSTNKATETRFKTCCSKVENGFSALDSAHAKLISKAMQPLESPLPAIIDDPCKHRNLAADLESYVSVVENPRAGLRTPSSRGTEILTQKDQELYDLYTLEEKVWTALLQSKKYQLISSNIDDVASTLQSYLERTIKAQYETTPLAHSRRILTGLALFVLVDAEVCSRAAYRGIPAKFSTDIDITLLERLHLPTRRMLQVCNDIETYLSSRNSVSASSIFSVEFATAIARQDPYMTSQLQSLVSRQTSMASAKMEEVERLFKKYDELTAALRELQCDGKQYYNRKYSKWCHDKLHCDYHIKTREREEVEKGTAPFFKFLPDGEADQLAVVFELNCDRTLRTWRDAAGLARVEILKLQARTDSGFGTSYSHSYDFGIRHSAAFSRTEVEDWCEYISGKVYISSSPRVFSHLFAYKLSSSRPQPSVEKRSLQYGRYESSWVLSNGRDVIPSVSLRSTDGSQSTVRLAFETPQASPTFKSLVTSLKMKPSDPYDSLVGAMDLPYPQNNAIAAQNKCPPGLSLNEFVAFGSLRNGEYTQYHQLTQLMARDALFWGHSSIAKLLVQLAWEGCQADPCAEHIFRVHSPLRNPEFAATLVDSLERVRAQQEDNWELPWSVFGLSAVAARIFGTVDEEEDEEEMEEKGEEEEEEEKAEEAEKAGEERGQDASQSNRRKLLGFFRRCRAMCLEKWLPKVEDMKLKAMAKGASGAEAVVVLREKAFSIALCGALTFMFLADKDPLSASGDVPVRLFRLHDTDIVAWLKLTSCMHENAPSAEALAKSEFLKQMVCVVRTLSFDILPVLNEHLRESPSALTEFSSKYLSSAPPGEKFSRPWTMSAASSTLAFQTKWTCTSSLGRTFEVYILSGALLIDGQETTVLPMQITDNPIYRSIFKDQTFNVHALGAGRGYETVKNRSSPSTFRFREYNSTQGQASLAVYLQPREDTLSMEGGSGVESCDELLFVPETHVRSYLPRHFGLDFSHWFSLRKRALFFLPKTFKEAAKFLPSNSTFAFCLEEQHLVRLQTPGNLGSSSAALIEMSHPVWTFWAGAMRLLEDEEFLHMWHARSGKKGVKIDLLRCQLSFTTSLESPKEILSEQYRGFRVALDQDKGLLYPLTRGLVIEENQHLLKDRSLLLPLSTKISLEETEGASVVNIELNASSPSVTILEYKYNRFLHVWREPAVGTPCLYLAFLLAVASHPRPHPIPRRTGTEAAIQLLLSAQARSPEPYDTIALNLLSQLRALSPIRRFKSAKTKKIAEISWPLGISPWVAREAFAKLSENLLQDNRVILPFFPERADPGALDGDLDDDQAMPRRQVPQGASSDPNLAARAYCRQSHVTGPLEEVPSHIWNAVAECESSRPNSAPWSHCSPGGMALLVARALSSRIDVLPASESLQTVDALFAALGKRLNPTVPLLASEGMIGARTTTRHLSPCEDFLTLVHLIVTTECHFMPLFVLPGLLLEDAATTTNLKIVDILARIFRVRPKIAVPANLSCEEVVASNLRELRSHIFEDMVSLFKERLIPFTQKEPAPPRAMQSSYMSTYQDAYEAMKLQYDLEKKLHFAQQAALVDLFKEVMPELLRDTFKSLEAYQPSAVRLLPEFAFRMPSLMDSAHVHADEFVSDASDYLHAKCSGFVAAQFLTALIGASSSSTASSVSTSSSFSSRSNVLRPLQSSIPRSKKLSFRTATETGEDFLALQTLYRPSWYGREGQSSSSSDIATLRTLLSASSDTLSQEIATSMGKSLEAFSSYVEPLAADVKPEDVVKYRTRTEDRAAEMEAVLMERMVASPDPSLSSLLQSAGIAPRPSRYLIAHLLAEQVRAPGTPRSLAPLVREELLPLLALVECWVHIQQADRIIRLHEEKSGFQRSRELLNHLHQNFSTLEHIAWLLFELETNVGIRSVQVRVAEAIIAPSGGAGHHHVMQLNMGEGKSTVILPMAAFELSRKQVVRVVVPEPLLRSTADTLSVRLGGLLNVRVHVLPSRRDMRFLASDLEDLTRFLQQLRIHGGVLVCSPEHALSLQLKAVETCGSMHGEVILQQPLSPAKQGQSKDPASAKDLLKLLHWYHHEVRDILDESDEVLHVRRQLVYTIGSQEDVDESKRRWTVVQAILAIACEQAPLWLQAYGDEVIELTPLFGESRSLNLPRFKNHPDTAGAFEELSKTILDEVLDGQIAKFGIPLFVQSMDKRMRDVVRKYVLTKRILSPSDPVLVDFENLDLPDKALFVILRGLLTYDVLLHALSKRYRVDFGVDLNTSRGMAVPFRAKDKASKNTEFGHVDVALCLTYISYYLGGLTKDMFKEVKNRLRREEDPGIVYKSWVDFYGSLSEPVKVPPALSTFKGLAFSDREQMTRLFVFLRGNPRVIDYYLENCVFRHELKQFPNKIAASPWNLVSSQRKHQVTGFSGTNDTQFLLPLTVSQSDLEELQHTNILVLEAILRKENQEVRPLTLVQNSTGICKNIISSLCSKDISVLIDVGALILEENSAFARSWLSQVESKRAVVYFDAKDELVVMSRDSAKARPLKLSPFVNNLEGCLIYLDEEHTRGTDLRIPGKSCAAVTLGPGLTRDKFVQACMRMRQLGREGGHTLCFFPTNEVELQLRSLAHSSSKAVTSLEVVKWVLQNTKRSIETLAMRWVQQGCMFASFEGSLSNSLTKGTGTPRQIFEAICEKDAQPLSKAYSRERMEMTFPDICKEVLQLSRVSGHNGGTIARDLLMKSGSVFKDIPKRFYNHLDEEQEREMEREQEMERHTERPVDILPREESVGLDFERFAYNNKLVVSESSQLSRSLFLYIGCLFESLSLTCKSRSHPLCKLWDKRLTCTTTFMETVRERHQYYSFARSTGGKGDSLDDFLRPVMWVVRRIGSAPADVTYVLVSPLEANFLAKCAASGSLHQNITLMLFAPRLAVQQPTLMEDPRLHFCSPSAVPFDTTTAGPVDRLVMAHLHLFAGSLFFETHEEQLLVCAILGLACRPLIGDEPAMLERGCIARDGFVSAPAREYRPVSDAREVVALCQVSESPVPALIEFLENSRKLRAHLPGSHMGNILFQSRMVEPGKPTNGLQSTDCPPKLLTVKAPNPV